MADYTVLAAELGVTSPQAIIARETYAAAMFDAACVGISLPGIDKPYGATPLTRDNASNPDAVGVAMTAATDTVFAAASQAGAPKQVASRARTLRTSCVTARATHYLLTTSSATSTMAT